MITRHRAMVGQWYLHRDNGETFLVVALDGDSGVVETQTFDGTVEELDAESWGALAIEPVDAPEDWTGPYDDIDAEDRGYTATGMSAHDWRRSLELIAADQDARSAAVLEDIRSAGLRRHS